MKGQHQGVMQWFKWLLPDFISHALITKREKWQWSVFHTIQRSRGISALHPMITWLVDYHIPNDRSATSHGYLNLTIADLVILPA